MDRRLFLASSSLLLLSACFSEKEDPIWDERRAEALELVKDPNVIFVQWWELDDAGELYRLKEFIGDQKYNIEQAFRYSAFVQDWSEGLVEDRNRSSHIHHNHPWFRKYWVIEERNLILDFHAVGNDTKYRHTVMRYDGEHK